MATKHIPPVQPYWVPDCSKLKDDPDYQFETETEATVCELVFNLINAKDLNSHSDHTYLKCSVRDLVNALFEKPIIGKHLLKGKSSGRA